MNIYREMNRASQTVGDWTEHQQAVRRLIEQAVTRTPKQEQAIVLGVGNGRDLPLEYLVETFEHVLLVDVDEVAVKRVASSLHHIKAGRAQWVTTDLTGFHAWVESQIVPPSQDAIREAWDSRSGTVDEDQPLAKWIGQGDLVVSIGVATQLLDPVLLCKWGPETVNRPEWRTVAKKAVEDHAELIRALRASGGVGALGTEIFSSEGAAPQRRIAFFDAVMQIDADTGAVLRTLNGLFPEARLELGATFSHAARPKPPVAWRWPWWFFPERLYLMQGWLLQD